MHDLLKEPAKILMFGHCHGVHLNPFGAALLEKMSLELSVFELASPGTENRGSARPGSLVNVGSSLGNPALSVTSSAANALRFPVRSIKRVARSLRILVRERSISAACREQRAAQSHFNRLRVFKSLNQHYDIYHLHFPTSSTLDAVALLPGSARLLVSFWGSDLLRMAGTRNYQRQSAILERADLITIRSTDLREILFAKFGRHLAPKTRIAKFGSGMLPELREADLAKLRADFREAHQIAPSKTVLCLGHNGFEENQHLPALESLAQLPAPDKQGTHLVLPMTYGAEASYISKVREAVSRAGFEASILTDFLDKSDILKLRAASDIIAHVPVSDALSAAMCETVYAGNVAITGAWLPYGELRRRNVFFREISTVHELGGCVSDTLRNLPSLRGRVEQTKSRIAEVLDWQKIISDWHLIYLELLGKPSGSC